MANIYTSVGQLIGNTPLLELGNFAAAHGAKARILGKLEGMNPGGSAKDRVAAAMIADAEQRGVLTKGGTIIEPTSGNTGTPRLPWATPSTWWATPRQTATRQP